MPSRGSSPGDATRNGLKQPTSSPGHSGGAVPELHRSSLFAGGKTSSATGHQSRRQSVGVGVGLSNETADPSRGRRVYHGADAAWQTLRVAVDPDVKP